MNKIKYLLSAIPAALFATSASADISEVVVRLLHTDAGGNASAPWVVRIICNVWNY